MPGRQDRVADQGRDQEPQRAHDGRAGADGLRERLERLPPGHPSSPYTGDGSRRPSVPGRDGRELPLPGEPDSGPGPVPDGQFRPDSAVDGDKARTGADGSWEWKGRHLTPEQSRIADQTLARCLAAEGRDANGNYTDRGITPAMRRIEAQLEHGHLVEDTEKFALKSPDRFKEKLAKLVQRFPGIDPAELVDEINDGIRYTFTFDLFHYTPGVDQVTSRLADAGYDHIETKPGWHGDEYKGVNSSWSEPATGLMFEVQFHTRESWEAKQRTHEAYERINMTTTPIGEVERLRSYQREVSATVPVPPGAFDIQHYKREK